MAMNGKKDLSNNVLGEGDDNSASKLTRSSRFQEKGQDEKISFSAKGIDVRREEKLQLDGLPTSRPSKTGNSSSQELSLNYLCDSPTVGFPEKELSRKSQADKLSQKGKGVVPHTEIKGGDEKWVERDFLNLNESGGGGSSKRAADEKVEDKGNVGGEKRPKLETLNLSLALPVVSVPLNASVPLANGDPRIKPKPIRVEHQSLPPGTNTNTTYSNDFTVASVPYSFSRSYSHNPSCSRTPNSTENYEFSVGKEEKFWCAGEGTNGSVHSKFRPVGDGVALAKPSGNTGTLSVLPSSLQTDKNNSLYKTTSSNSLFPSELPARPHIGNQSGDSKKQDSEDVIVLGSTDGGRNRKSSNVERIVRDIVNESIPAMAQMVQELPQETLQSVREHLRNLIERQDKKEEFAVHQKQLASRADLTKETLLKCHKDQIELLVALKMGLKSFLSGKTRLHTSELVDIFLFKRCRNVNCKQLLPVDDCDCKICSGNKGFCSSCMCPVCHKFDSASNTCTWVGCDVCSHWCHAACGIEKNLIKPGPSLKGPSGTTEMQFHCMGCGHASEMFGFVKDVFLCCAKDWGLETLVKELDCVKKIFGGSDDLRGRQLCVTADELLSKLQKKLMSVSDACNIIFRIFNRTDYIVDFSVSSRDTRRDEASVTPPKYTVRKIASSSGQPEIIPSTEPHQRELKATLLGDLKAAGRLVKNDKFDTLERMVRIKEAEARMFQKKADEANREAESLKKMIQARIKILEEDYAEKLAKLCVHETEERRRKRLDELKALENSQCDYYKMKVRMQTEIAGLLERMEATKHKLV